MNKASLFKRFIATIIDGLVVGIVTSVVVLLLAALMAITGNEVDPASSEFSILNLFDLLVRLLCIYYYFGYFYSTRGATPGKQLLGLRVVSYEDGSYLSYGAAFARETVGKFLSAIVLFLGYVVAIFNEDGRAWHDRIVGSIVIRDEN